VDDGNSILWALELQERYQISLQDSLVSHAARAAGVAILYSETLSDGERYGEV
jgi:predicted nucleic acid-binding protein